MKKRRKLLAGLLSIALVVSAIPTVVLPSHAANVVMEQSAVVATTGSDATTGTDATTTGTDATSPTDPKPTATPAPTVYTATFDANGGTGTMNSVTDLSMGDKFVLPANGFTAPTGMKFKAWSINGMEYASNSQYTVTGSFTVKAVWEQEPQEEVMYTVSFNADGGTGTMASVEVKDGDNYVLPYSTFTAPSGKTFDTWYVYEQEVNPSTPITVTGDVVVTAVWAKEAVMSTGASGVVVKEGESATFGSEAPIESYLETRINGMVVPEDYLKVVSGSTIVTVNPEYLKTLAHGDHVLQIVSTPEYGIATATFTVAPTSTTTPAPEATPTPTPSTSTAPQTGDSSAPILLLLVAQFAVVGIIGLKVYSKRKLQK